ncbi:MAG: hypothetical protein BWY25_03029 [Chloroflexi bacterium ADurb.Bin222]|nr:MAG: hypothetical protein BWY25_03029 [Chloroflexi bacterium ADurb.Bin222]
MGDARPRAHSPRRTRRRKPHPIVLNLEAPGDRVGGATVTGSQRGGHDSSSQVDVRRGSDGSGHPITEIPQIRRGVLTQVGERHSVGANHRRVEAESRFWHQRGHGHRRRSAGRGHGPAPRGRLCRTARYQRPRRDTAHPHLSRQGKRRAQRQCLVAPDDGVPLQAAVSARAEESDPGRQRHPYHRLRRRGSGGVGKPHGVSQERAGSHQRRRRGRGDLERIPPGHSRQARGNAHRGLDEVDVVRHVEMLQAVGGAMIVSVEIPVGIIFDRQNGRVAALPEGSVIAGAHARAADVRRERESVSVDHADEGVGDGPIAGIARIRSRAGEEVEVRLTGGIPGEHVHVVHGDDVIPGVADRSRVLIAAEQSLLLAGEEDKAHGPIQVVAAEDIGRRQHRRRAAGVVIRARGGIIAGRVAVGDGIQVRGDQDNFVRADGAGNDADHVAIAVPIAGPRVIADVQSQRSEALVGVLGRPGDGRPGIGVARGEDVRCAAHGDGSFAAQPADGSAQSVPGHLREALTDQGLVMQQRRRRREGSGSQRQRDVPQPLQLQAQRAQALRLSRRGAQQQPRPIHEQRLSHVGREQLQEVLPLQATMRQKIRARLCSRVQHAERGAGAFQLRQRREGQHDLLSGSALPVGQDRERQGVQPAGGENLRQNGGSGDLSPRRTRRQRQQQRSQKQPGKFAFEGHP